MESLSDKARGIVYIKILGAEPSRFLEECANEMIEFWGAYPHDQFTLTIAMRLKSVDKLEKLAQKSCCEIEIIESKGGPIYLKRLRRRFAMWALPLLFGALLIFSSFFVWNIEINGNEKVSKTEILNALEESGVKIGSFWPGFTSDEIRTRVLLLVPELKWLSVSTFGSRAYIEVRERTDIPEIFDEDAYFRVVAGNAGIIEEINALSGRAMFSVGQTAVKGDVLIESAVESPYAGVRYVHASGDVTARTWYELSAFMPLEYAQKVYTGGSSSRFSLKIGDTRINFYRNSGILRTMCDNIITEQKLGIDGLFTLPVSIICERSEEYELQVASNSEAQAFRLLEMRLNEALLHEIGDGGEILSSELSVNVVGSCALATLRAECRQDIAKQVPLTDAEILYSGYLK